MHYAVAWVRRGVLAPVWCFETGGSTAMSGSRKLLARAAVFARCNEERIGISRTGVYHFETRRERATILHLLCESIIMFDKSLWTGQLPRKQSDI